MFTDILLAATPSEVNQWAAQAAFALARKHQARICLLHVCGPPVYGWSDIEYLNPSGELDRVKARIEESCRDQYQETDKLTVEVVAGLPHEEILRFSRKKNIDLIVMGSREKSRPERRPTTWGMTGTTMEMVSQRAHCPVMIVSRPVAKESLTFSNLVMATDFSDQSECALGYAGQLSRHYKAKLFVVHVLDVGSQYERLKVYQEDIEKLIEEAKGRIAREFEPMLRGVNHQLEVWEGVPYVEILKVARREKADLILMAHHAKNKDPEKAFLGSTVAQVAIRSACPTVSVNKHFDVRCAVY
ncbi:MAG: universal stress protein [Thermodesulfobacteriota bacterium]